MYIVFKDKSRTKLPDQPWEGQILLQAAAKRWNIRHVVRDYYDDDLHEVAP